MPDNIDNLPVDQSPPSSGEVEVVNMLFKEKEGVIKKVVKGTKDILIAGVLFIVFSLTFLDEYIKKYITITSTSPYILCIVKAFLFMVALFIVKYFYLSQK